VLGCGVQRAEFRNAIEQMIVTPGRYSRRLRSAARSRWASGPHAGSDAIQAEIFKNYALKSIDDTQTFLHLYHFHIRMT
jgi:hypothetical protein